MNLECLQSTAIRVAIKVYLTSDHVSVATGKTVAVTISKNGAAFANPSGGATNATEIGSGWYYVDLTTTDTATLGPLIVLGTATACDPADKSYVVVKATNRGNTAIPDALASASGGLPVLNASLNVAADLQTIKTQAVTCAAGVTVPTSLASPTNITAATGIVLSGVTHTGAVIPTVTTCTTATNLTNAPTAGDFTATMKTSIGTAVAGSAVASVTGNVGGNVVGSVGSLTLTQAIPTSNTAQTLGDCLNAARAQGFGKWSLSGTTLTLYASDGTTAVRTFTLDSSTSPTSRT